jgi:hypothetical protein
VRLEFVLHFPKKILYPRLKVTPPVTARMENADSNDNEKENIMSTKQVKKTIEVKPQDEDEVPIPKRKPTCLHFGSGIPAPFYKRLYIGATIAGAAILGLLLFNK